VNEQSYADDIKCLQCSDENFEMDCGNPEEDGVADFILKI